MPEYEWETSPDERYEQYRRTYRQLVGLAIFESFEEYCKDREEDEH